MKTWVVTLTHTDLSLLESSLKSFYETATGGYEHILLDHHWPIDYWAHRHAILRLAEKYGCKVMSNYENVGGHGGLNWVMRNLPLADDDLVMNFDGDSFPVNPGWDVAMTKAMSDHRFGYVSLFIDVDLNCKHWPEEPSTSGIKMVRAGTGIEMINISMFRYSFLKEVGLLQAQYKYYGQVEAPMMALLQQRGLKHGYLADFKEVGRAYHPNQVYTDWKRDHVSGIFPGNFREYYERSRLSP